MRVGAVAAAEQMTAGRKNVASRDGKRNIGGLSGDDLIGWTLVARI
jgi:hypothetical protein